MTNLKVKTNFSGQTIFVDIDVHKKVGTSASI